MAEDWRSRTGHYLGCLVSVRMCTCEQSSKEAGEALFLSSSFSPLDFLQSFNFPTASCLQSPYIYEARIPGWQDDSAMSQMRSKRWNATTRSPMYLFPRSPPPKSFLRRIQPLARVHPHPCKLWTNKDEYTHSHFCLHLSLLPCYLHTFLLFWFREHFSICFCSLALLEIRHRQNYSPWTHRGNKAGRWRVYLFAVLEWKEWQFEQN